QRGELDGPGSEADEHRDEIERQGQEIAAERLAAVSFHRPETAFHDVPADADPEKLAVGTDQGRDSPQTNNAQGEKDADRKPKPAVERLPAQDEFHPRDGEERHPAKRTLRQ